MSGFGSLIACAGRWQGSSELQDPTTGKPEASLSRLTVTPILKETFVRLDYDWRYQDTPQEGSLLVGFQDKAAAFTGCWMDTWHMGRDVMVCRGSAEASGGISLQGFYAALSGPDWGWRIVLTVDAGERIRLVMHNVSPEGEVYPAVEADYRPEEQV